MNRIYFDHAATTPLDPGVLKAMEPYLKEIYGNPSSLYETGRIARKGVEEARATLAGCIGAQPNEIIFTSGGTESDNLAVKGFARANKQKGNHLVISSIEHPAVLEPAKSLKEEGFLVSQLPVGSNGVVKLDELDDIVSDQTILISVMLANNVIGTLQPLGQITSFARQRGIRVHTDAVQVVGALPVDIEGLAIDLLTMSAHKRYGPKGTGALYVRKGVKIKPVNEGGGHERSLRSGTENVPGIVGMAKAMKLATERLEQDSERIRSLRDLIIEGVMNSVDEVELLGDAESRLPGNACFSIKYIEGESMVLHLDAAGIAVSSGSACASSSLKPSHVLLALGLQMEEAHGSLRITLGRENTVEEVDYFLKVFPPIVEKLRAMSPLYGKV